MDVTIISIDSCNLIGKKKENAVTSASHGFRNYTYQ